MPEFAETENERRNRIAALLMAAPDIVPHSPTSSFTPEPSDFPTGMPMSVPDMSMVPTAPPDDRTITDEQSMKSQADQDIADFFSNSMSDKEMDVSPDKGSPADVGKQSFDPGAMTTSMAALTPNAPGWEGAGRSNVSDMFDPDSNALTPDIAEEGPIGVWDFSPTAPPDTTPAPAVPGAPDFASMAPTGGSFTAGFAQGFDMAAAAFGGGGQGADPGDGGGGLGAVGGTEGSGSGDTAAGGVG